MRGAARPLPAGLLPAVVHTLAKHPRVAGVFPIAESLDMAVRWSA